MTDVSSAIARLRELRAKAYKGKWSVNGELGLEGERSSATDYDPLVLGGLKGGRGYIEYPHYSLYSQPTKTEGKANAAAIVALHNAAPALLDAADRLARIEAVMGSDEAVERVAFVFADKLADLLGLSLSASHSDKAATAALAALRELIGGDDEIGEALARK
jgi:hypothetical protein